MRSRYCAFALGETDYLLETWHPDNRPRELQPDEHIRWIGLEILFEEHRDSNATVEFEALMMAGGKVSAMHERSEFVFQQGRWLYTTGEQLAPSITPYKPARNQVCPCGSGAKFKRCCAKP